MHKCLKDFKLIYLREPGILPVLYSLNDAGEGQIPAMPDGRTTLSAYRERQRQLKSSVYGGWEEDGTMWHDLGVRNKPLDGLHVYGGSKAGSGSLILFFPCILDGAEMGRLTGCRKHGTTLSGIACIVTRGGSLSWTGCLLALLTLSTYIPTIHFFKLS